MLPDIQRAIAMQHTDDRIAALTKEISALPKHIAEIEKKLDGSKRKLEHDRAALAANQRERKRLEGEIQAQDAKVSKLKTQMMEAKTNDQYRAFQHEIDFCQSEIRKSEDRTLELMSESEPLDKNVKSAESTLASEQKQVDAEKAQARERTAADQKEIDRLKRERARVAAEMTPSVLSEYERIRKGRGGVAVAEAVNGRCSKCNMLLRLQYLQELRRGDRVMNCESCGRILYYNPPESFEDLAAETHQAARG
jgi:predicted  nucleic acid-binding Zn-ribbon protein